MGKGKIAASVTTAALVIAALAYFFIVPKNVDILPVTPEEAAAAYAYLQSTLEGGRYAYADYLKDNSAAADASGVTCEDISVTLAPGEAVSFNVNAGTAGFARFAARLSIEGVTLNGATVGVSINGEQPFYEADNIALPVYWKDKSKVFLKDRFGDETVPEQERMESPGRLPLYDNKYSSAEPLKFLLRQGDNTVELINNSPKTVGIYSFAALDGDVTDTPRSPDKDTGGAFVEINATEYEYKNSTYIQLFSASNPAVAPFDAVDKKINAISLPKAGNEVTFGFTAADDGYYSVAVHAMTDDADFATFAAMKIDGKTVGPNDVFILDPPGMNRWGNFIWTEESGESVRVYLDRGEHKLSLKLETSPIYEQLRALQLLTDHINQFALDIKRVTGKEIDKNRTWRLTRYIPETEVYLDAYDTVIRSLIGELSKYSKKGENSSTLTNLTESIVLLTKLRKEPDELPLYANTLASMGGYDTSVVKLCAAAVDKLTGRGLAIDRVYVYSEDGQSKLPKPNASFGTTLLSGVKSLVSSYTSSKYVVRNAEGSINIWVNQSVIHTDVMQKLIDARFTPATGIKVHLSVMPDVNKLVLSKAAGTNPDMALGLQSYMPFDLASRGALYDMSEQPDFWQYMSQMSPGAMVAYVFNGGVYAVPETVDFAALVYRKDIFEQLSLSPPDTWTDVCEITPALQRFDMSFYLPIAFREGYKWFYQTSPLIYQNGGTLYSPDGLSTAIGEPNAVKGITLLGDLFTTYALEKQVPVFFNSFRFGKTPAGIIDSADYMLLKNGAPELSGQWALAPYPGVMREDGEIDRWYIGNGRGGVIFKDTNMTKDDCWAFMKWWLSRDVQTEYSFNLASNYNILWLSANREALLDAPVDAEDLQVVLDSVKWLRDAPRSPGQYMLERSLSDIWNTMVFDDTPARAAIDLKIVDIQREFRRKMQEFGYLDGAGNPIVEYTVHEIDWIEDKMKGAAGQ